MSALPRALLIFGLVLPLAVVMGYLVSEPLDQMSLLGVGAVIMLLLSPLLIKYHHLTLIIVANAFINAFFLPGQPAMWMLLGGVSFGMSLLSWPLDRTSRVYCGTPSVDYPVILLVLVLLFTAWMNGGIGFRLFGGESFGGRRYVTVLATLFAYFALVMIPLPARLVSRVTGLYWISGVSAVFGNLSFFLGPNFYFLFYLFPVELVLSQANADVLESAGGLSRSVGLGSAGLAIISFLFCRHGIAGLLQRGNAWRLLWVILAVGLILASGFRSNLILAFLIFGFQFFYEGLHRTKYMAVSAAAMAAFLVFVFAFSEKLPLAMQRGLSFLPIKIDTLARYDADASLQWRLEMWQVLLGDIPKYFWVGKGFTVDPKDLYFVQDAMKRGFASGYEGAIVAGDYHSGPLSILLPFGIFGLLTFAWLLASGFSVLRRNYLHGSPDLRVANRFFLVFFCARVIFFVFFFGAFSNDFWLFSSLIGLSLSINRGVAKKPVPSPLPAIVKQRPLLVGEAVSLI